MTHPAIRDLLLGLARHPSFQGLMQRLRAPAPDERVALSGLTLTAKALYLVLLWHLTEKPVLVVVDGNKQAESLTLAVEAFFDLLAEGRSAPRPVLLPALDVLPNQGLSPHAEVTEERAVGLWKLASGQASIVITPVGSALLRLEPGEFYRQLPQTLAVGDEVPLDELIAHLESVGYQRREPVESVGEYSLRGGILDVFSPEARQPVRIEFFGDQVESIRHFAVESQRSVLKVPECVLLPLTEFIRSSGILQRVYEKLLEAGLPRHELPPVPGEPYPGWEFTLSLVRPRHHSLFDLAAEAVLVLDEPEQTRGAAARLWKRLDLEDRTISCPPESLLFRWEEIEGKLGSHRQIELRELDLDSGGSDQPSLARFHIPTRPSLSFRGNLQVAIAEARTLAESGAKAVFFAATSGEVERLADVFNEYGVPYQLGLSPSGEIPAYLSERAYFAGSVANVFIVKGAIERGAFLVDGRVALFGSEDLFETSDLVARPASKSHLASFSADLLDLNPGDFIVHAEHGVGRFLGLKEIEHGSVRGDFMMIEYAGASKLYVPLAHMDLVQRFRGAGGEAQPPLDRLGGATWSRTKTRVKAKMRDMAEELLKLYAARRLAEGFAYSPDSNWQREFEDAFEFEETADQITSIQEIKRDMERPQPMDRLLCGDVGFGKTEVVMRSTFKALGDGKQVAVLAPTTVLCFQHFETFKRRFQPFPVRVEMFSRFRSARELKASLADLAEGKVDVAIGTHRLLSKDVEFRDLGLLVVDEEQRFGVRHKERLKQIRQNVDVVSMSATPIPRTLHMSLLGLRDLSVIETPPKDRLAIQTVVAHFHPELIRTALELELGRGGQVYFVHNRVETIWDRAALLQQFVPQARIGVGHGQMNEAELEKVMLRFMRHDYDILVCTTIIENGLDIPLANTIVIDHAERYGLSELYQLRGRVGRSNRRAYAYLLVPPDKELTEIARKRLAALKEFSDLGAGFKIAALDLELRGAGNLLGGEQHGHINVVGFDMYVRLLEDSVRELRGEEVPLEIHSSLSLGLDIRIPPEYIADENQRLRAYRSIANAQDEKERDRVLEELVDRYGSAPREIHNLLAYTTLKNLARKIGIESIDRRHDQVNFKFHKEARLDPDRLMAIVRKNRGAQFTPAGVLRLQLDAPGDAGEVLSQMKEWLVQLQG